MPFKNPEDAKAWRKKNWERLKASLYKWRRENKDKHYAIIARYEAKNPEKKKLWNSKWVKRNPGKNAAKRALYRARLKQATPKWADLEAIKQFYINCPEGYEVDHTIPLKGINISGLHTLENLQYLPIKLNRSKGNKV